MSTIKRLEATCVDPEVTEGLSAVIADPLWNLARQWQVGEFRGEDAATPIIIEAKIKCFPVNMVWSGDSPKHQIHRLEENAAPLEALIEGDKAEFVITDRLRLELSASLQHALQQHGDSYDPIMDTLRSIYPFIITETASDDPTGQARLRLLAQIYAFDGYAIIQDIIAMKSIENTLLIKKSHETFHDTIIDVVGPWAEREKTFVIHSAGQKKTPSTWVDRAQEYKFGVSVLDKDSNNSIHLTASEYPGGQLDWYNFDILNDEKPSMEAAIEHNIRVLSSPLQFAGQPASRFWEIEEGDTYFGDLGGGPDDLARSVIASYAAVAGDDWYVIPATLPSSTVNQIVEFRILDDFDPKWKTVTSVAENDEKIYSTDRPWRWFELSIPSNADSKSIPLLFLPPITTTLQQGPVLDRVEFRRDEMANLAWAIEQTYQGEYARGVKRETPPQKPSHRPPVNVEGEDKPWEFQLGTEVPANWLPLLPIRSDPNSSQVVLRRGRMAETISGKPSKALGVLLTPDRTFILNEEEIPHGGIYVTRRAQMTRSADGSAHLWYGRKKGLSSGPLERTPLEFDTLTGWPQSSKRKS